MLHDQFHFTAGGNDIEITAGKLIKSAEFYTQVSVQRPKLYYGFKPVKTAYGNVSFLGMPEVELKKIDQPLEIGFTAYPRNTLALKRRRQANNN